MKLLQTLSIFVFYCCSVVAQQAKSLAAAEYFQQGKFNEAKESIDQACQHDETKGNPKVWYLKSFIYSEMARDTKFNTQYTGLSEDALEAAKKSINLDKEKKYINDNQRVLLNISLLFFNKSIALYNKGLDDNDKDAYSLALQSFEKFYESYSLLGEETSELINHFKESDVLLSDIARFAAYSAQYSNNNETAKKYYQKVIDYEVDDPVSYINYSKILFDEGKTDDAIKVIEKARKINPAYTDYTVSELNIYYKSGRLNDYIIKMEEAIQIHPNNANLIATLAHTYTMLNKEAVEQGDKIKAKAYSDKAIENYKKAITAKTDNPELLFKILYNLGLLYYNPGLEIYNKAAGMSEGEEKNKLTEKYKSLFNDAILNFNSAFELNKNHRELVKCLIKIYMALDNAEKMNEYTNHLKTITE